MVLELCVKVNGLRSIRGESTAFLSCSSSPGINIRKERKIREDVYRLKQYAGSGGDGTSILETLLWPNVTISNITKLLLFPCPRTQRGNGAALRLL